MCGGRLPVERSISTRSAASGRDARMMSAKSVGLKRRKRLDRFQYIGRPWQDGVFEIRGVGDRAIEGRHTRDGSVEVLEQILRDACSDLSTEAGGQLILVRDDDSAGLLRVLGDRGPVVRNDRAQVENRNTNTRPFGLLCRKQRPLD